MCDLPRLHSTNPIERLNGEIKRRTEVVGIFPNQDAIVRLIGEILLEQNDELAVRVNGADVAISFPNLPFAGHRDLTIFQSVDV